VRGPSASLARRSHRLAAFALVLALAGAPAGADPALPDPAQAAAAIDDLHRTLTAVMKSAAQLGFDGRVREIQPVLVAHYDFPFMAEKSIGLGWKQLDEAQRARLVDAFTRLAVSTYAARFDGFEGERFETLGTEPASHGTLLVKTQIVRANGEKVPLDYRMRPLEGAWRIIDVFFNGTVSELALRRSEYSSVLKREGFDGLMAALEQKIAAQKEGGSEASSGS
jgi:phospholipid transport system substrate-binding protein